MAAQYNISKDQLRRIQDAVEATVKAAIAAEGLEFQGFSGKYGDRGVLSFEFSAVEMNANGVNTKTAEAQSFILHADLLGVSPDALGSRIVWGGREFILTGYRPRARKFPIMVKDANAGTAHGLPEMALKNII